MVESTSRQLATVLVVDDDLNISRLVTRILAAKRYRVLDAAHAVHALELCHLFPEPIDLLLTDIRMPFINGRELACRALALRPQMRVLFISGTEDHVPDLGIDSKASFLQKPFVAHELLEKVRETLGSSGGP